MSFNNFIEDNYFLKPSYISVYSKTFFGLYINKKRQNYI